MEDVNNIVDNTPNRVSKFIIIVDKISRVNNPVIVHRLSSSFPQLIHSTMWITYRYQC